MAHHHGTPRSCFVACFAAAQLLACTMQSQSERASSDDAENGPPSGSGASAGTAGGGGAASGAAGSIAITPGASAGTGGTSTGGSATGGSASRLPEPGSSAGGTTATGGSAGSAGSSSSGAAGTGQGVSAGTLTAGAWDDNRNYDFFTEYRSLMRNSGRAGLLPFTEGEYDDAFGSFMGQLSSRRTLDVALVIDTTGSMGDEMAYLRTEFLALSQAINDEYPSAAQRWSLVVYRDEGDLYVVRSYDFTDDVEAFQSTLARQDADGGGDVPEAPDQALAATADLAWRSDSATARLAFWVADAPHHAENAGAMADAVRALRDAGVHLYPVASSGVDELSEHSMRSAAQLTGGRYLFLTNDSGIGGNHKEPTIPCYFVTRLDDAILRMVDIELSGVYHEPTTAQIIRTGGNPEDGSCRLTSGDIVFAY